MAEPLKTRLKNRLAWKEDELEVTVVKSTIVKEDEDHPEECEKSCCN